MSRIGKAFLTLFAVIAGLATLYSVLFMPEIGQTLLAWGTLMAAFALLLGIFNLSRIHLNRAARERNLLSLVLVLSMLAVFGLAVTDLLAITQDGVTNTFNYVQAPLETAVASLLAFVLLFAGFRLLQRQRSFWSVLFLITAVFILVSSIPLLGNGVRLFRTTLEATIVTAGMRGILIGVALGSITLSMRLLLGLDQPYNQ